MTKCVFRRITIIFTIIRSYETLDNPLILTKYIESGDIQEARRLARVPFSDNFGIKSYAGFFTVNKEYNSNLFMWYFPPILSSNRDAPVILWLQGGPGTSGLFGQFTLHGPLKISKGKLKSRKYTWAQNFHMIYIDNPVGTGFSFTDSQEGYCTNQTQIATDLYSAVLQFYQLFPELQSNELFIVGESYAGKYIPGLGYHIHRNNPSAISNINLRGLAIGNGLCDPVNQLVHSKYLYQIGLVDQKQAKIYESYENEIISLIKKSDWDGAYNLTNILLNFEGDINDKSVFKNTTGFDFYYNYLYSKDYRPAYRTILDKPYVRDGLHVGDLPFQISPLVMKYLRADIMKSVAPWLKELIDHYPVMIYTGLLDIIITKSGTDNYLNNLNFKGVDEYKNSNKSIWFVDNEIAGYVNRGGNLVHVSIRNAGHMVPFDQSKWALDMITRFTQGLWNVDEN